MRRWPPSGVTFCHTVPRVLLFPQPASGNPPGHRAQPTADTVQQHSPGFWAPLQSLLPTLLRPWAAVFKIKTRKKKLSCPSSFQKALEDPADDKNKNKSKLADKSVTQSFDSRQERAVQSADCKVIDRGVHFTHFHSNLAVPVPQCQDRSLVQGGMKKGQKRRNNYKAQGTKNGKGKGVFKCSAICSTENFHFANWCRGKKARQISVFWHSLRKSPMWRYNWHRLNSKSTNAKKLTGLSDNQMILLWLTLILWDSCLYLVKSWGPSVKRMMT